VSSANTQTRPSGWNDAYLTGAAADLAATRAQTNAGAATESKRVTMLGIAGAGNGLGNANGARRSGRR